MYVGINHGIEIFEDNIEFAEERLKQFKEDSSWFVSHKIQIESHRISLGMIQLSFVNLIL